jgi:HAD superfamily hydrolase (TIGR01549 family)
MSLDNVIFDSIDRQHVRGLLFDVDGTLVDTDDQMVERLSKFLRPVRFLFKKGDPKKFSRWCIMRAESPANFLYQLSDRLGIDAVLAKFYSRISKRNRDESVQDDDIHLIPGVPEMLMRLSRVYPMAVVSARDAHSTIRLLEKFDLIHYFQAVITSQTCQHTKPFPDPILFAAEQLDLSPESCVMVGDTIVDMIAGKAAGAQTVAVLCGFGTLQELKRSGADLVLSSTPNMADILLG